MIIEADTILSILSMTELDYKNKKLVETNVSKIQYHSHTQDSHEDEVEDSTKKCQYYYKDSDWSIFSSG